MEFDIDGKKIEFDETKTYLDFFLDGGEQKLVEVDLEAVLKAIEEGKIPVDDALKKNMEYFKRWTIDAPRKRGYRRMRADGFNILSSEQFFDEKGGEEIIDNLENTGKFAEYFLKTIYSEKQDI